MLMCRVAAEWHIKAGPLTRSEDKKTNCRKRLARTVFRMLYKTVNSLT